MHKKINVYINGVFSFSTNKYKTCTECIKDIRNTKHLYIASVPDKYITVYDYDEVRATYK